MNQSEFCSLDMLLKITYKIIIKVGFLSCLTYVIDTTESTNGREKNRRTQPVGKLIEYFVFSDNSIACAVKE